MQIQGGANAGCRRNLDAAPILAANEVVINLARVSDLRQLTISHASDRAKRDDHILERYRNSVLQNIFQQIAALAQP
ncbi:MAG TPA: hypothetical protein PKC18_04225, partial [Lacipirellulaceae bacterium]|nr:hypothetical protein [Lacipirellulaceae bacterium]